MPLLAALTPFADWNGPGWWIVFFPIGWFVFFLLIFFVFRRAGWWGYGRGCGPRFGRRGRGGGADPLEILDRRFAEGQIEAEEFGERRQALEQHADRETGR